MGNLLERAKMWGAASIWKAENVGDAIEGTVLAIRRATGKFESTRYLLACEDGTKRILQVGDDTVLGGKLAGDPPQVRDEIVVVYLGIPEGKKYKLWDYDVEHANETGKPAESLSDDDVPF